LRRSTLFALSLAFAGGLAAAAPLRAQSPSKPEAKKVEAGKVEAGKAGAKAAVDSLALARQFTQWFYNAQWDSLLAHSPAGERPSRDEMQRQLDLLTARAGTETQVLEEKFVMRKGRPQYWRTAKFSAMEEPILLRWVIDPTGQIAGMGLGPASQAPPIDPPQGAAAPAK
jgi:hypothetical protein